METIVRRCAGLDVHKESVVACARVIDDNGELQLSTQTFGTTMSDLLVLGDWLASHGVTLVGMESTGVFWKPVYMLLETEFECWLLNAQHLRNVPGRKTDVADAAWIAQLVAHGLVRPSFVPPKEIRELREVTRYRRRSFKSARGRLNGYTRSSKAPVSSSPISPPTFWAFRGEPC
jgi:transposase